MRHLTESINISDFSYISSILVRSIAVSHPASHLIALRELIQSLFLLFLPRLLIFALFSSLISFPTHTHTHKNTAVSFLRPHGKLFRSLFYADFRIETVHFLECS